MIRLLPGPGGHQRRLLLITIAILVLTTLVGCSPSAADLAAVDYTPLVQGDWKVSTPAEQGLEPKLVAELYHNAAKLESLYGLLVVKNGHLIAEGYFNEGAVDRKNEMQSATKSVTSALVGIALDQGCLSSVNQRMLEFFPEWTGLITDPRKKQITIQHLLQMRSGYPDEETDPGLFAGLLTGDYLPLVAGFPLISDPGTAWHYSSVTAHWLGVIVSRACDTDLKSFAEEHLFSPLDIEVGDWLQFEDGYYSGLAGMHLSARDMAKFGLLYLNDGVYEGSRVLSADWIRDSLQRYSEGVYGSYGHLRDIGYGYQWWSGRAGDRYFNYAAGHGGQYIALLDDLDMVIVAIGDPFWQQHDDESWKHEKATITLVGRFIDTLPSE